MSEIKFHSGWLLPKGINVEPTPVLVPNNAASISAMLGCQWIDVIRNDVGSSDGEMTTIVGYVDDEGLLKDVGMADINHLAMHLFHRDQPIVGDVLVVGGCNSDGDYDGDNHDLPEWLTECGDVLVEGAAERYNSAMGGMLAIMAALKDGVIDRDSFIDILEDDSEDADDKFVEQAKIAIRYAEMLVEDDTSTPIVDGFEKLLEEES